MATKSPSGIRQLPYRRLPLPTLNTPAIDTILLGMTPTVGLQKDPRMATLTRLKQGLIAILLVRTRCPGTMKPLIITSLDILTNLDLWMTAGKETLKKIELE
jgi:hypothetical protein